MTVVSEATRVRIFGRPGHVDRVIVETPWGVRTQCHRLIAPLFLEACRDAAQRSSWRPRRIDAYNPRPIRGTENRPVPVWSMHAWSLAWDFFATGPTVPPPGGVWTPDNPVTPAFAACFTRRGFRWGANFGRRDLPHIEWPAGLPAQPQEDPMANYAAQLDRIERRLEDVARGVVIVAGAIAELDDDIPENLTAELDEVRVNLRRGLEALDVPKADIKR